VTKGQGLPPGMGCPQPPYLRESHPSSSPGESIPRWRGGSWFNYVADSLRASGLYYRHPDDHLDNDGFRVAAAAPEDSKSLPLVL
jgi:hypothetical protein